MILSCVALITATQCTSLKSWPPEAKAELPGRRSPFPRITSSPVFRCSASAAPLSPHSSHICLMTQLTPRKCGPEDRRKQEHRDKGLPKPTPKLTQRPPNPNLSPVTNSTSHNILLRLSVVHPQPATSCSSPIVTSGEPLPMSQSRHRWSQVTSTVQTMLRFSPVYLRIDVLSGNDHS